MTKLDITALILTYNEEKHIARCIDSVKEIVSDIVIVDSFSTDSTVELAADGGARVFQNAWRNYASQFQWGLDNANIDSKWVMRIDADEILETKKEHLAEIVSLPDDVKGIYVKRKYYFMGKWIKHGGMYPIYHLRIWQKSSGRIENRWMDEHIVLEKGETICLDVNIVDDNKNSLSWWVNKHNSYATREMIDNLNLKYKFMPIDDAIARSGEKQVFLKRVVKEKMYFKLPLFVRPFLYFIYRYVFRLGFLDGVKGFIFHILQGFWYRMLVDCKQYEALSWLNGETRPAEIKKILKERTSLDI